MRMHHPAVTMYYNPLRPNNMLSWDSWKREGWQRKGKRRGRRREGGEFQFVRAIIVYSF